VRPGPNNRDHSRTSVGCSLAYWKAAVRGTGVPMTWRKDHWLAGKGEKPNDRRGPDGRQWSSQDPQRLAWFEALYDMHHRRAFGLAFMLLRDLHDAEDVLQEAFLGAWRSGRTPDPDEPGTRTWLLTIVRNRAIDVLRGLRRLPATG